jgi:predicted AlkP superfamily phosphohydrolase/phosphomutase
VLVLLNFDSASLPVLERMMDDGRLPTVADLFKRGRRSTLETPAVDFPAASYPVLYSGLDLSKHGLYYTFLWSPEEQRIRYVDRFQAPPSAWEVVSEQGAHVLVIDPYEAMVPAALNGYCFAGWQFRNRVVLPGWSRPRSAFGRFRRRFGRPPSLDEVFGTQSLSLLRTMQRNLLDAPGRVADLATHLLSRERFDLLWLTFSASHLAGHQFWDLSQLEPTELETAKREGLSETLERVYERIDSALAEILDQLPPDAEIVLFSIMGMGPNTSRVDFLPDMLDAVLRGARSEDRPAPGSLLWRLRAAVPTQARTRIAEALPRRAVIELTTRLETRGIDWSKVRAFAVPSDALGYIRLNLRGRERDGTVAPDQADALVDEIVAGLTSFTDSDGSPTIAAVERVPESYRSANGAPLLPDLLVRWSDRPAAGVGRISSPTFGEIRRRGTGSGRSGNHNPDAWAVVVAPDSRRHDNKGGPSRVVDLAATVCAAFGAETDRLSGEPFLR